MLWVKLLLVFLVVNSVILVVSFWQCYFLKNPFGRCHLAILGSFVWGDAVVFSIFWIILSFFTLIFVKSFNFFLFAASVYYVVRGFGETIYWLNQQFSKINRNPPKNFLIHKIFPGEAVWFIYQITWQVVMVIAIICSVYFGAKWINGLN